MILKLDSLLTDEEMLDFKIPNTLELNNFYGVQYAMCIAGITKDSKDNKIFNPAYSMTYINTDITPERVLDFCNKHKEDILKTKILDNGRFTSIYYVVYKREEKPMLVNEFSRCNSCYVDVELTICDNGFYRVQEVHLELSENSSILGSLYALFSNENINGIPFISANNNRYFIEYYDEYGESKKFVYDDISNIFKHITNVRLVGYKEK